MGITYEPLYDRIIVRVIDQEDRTSGGLIIPALALDNTPYLKAEVISVGHGRVTSSGDVVPLRVKPGDVIAFFRSASGGDQLVFPDPDKPGKELMLIREPSCTWIFRGLAGVSRITGLDGRGLDLPAGAS